MIAKNQRVLIYQDPYTKTKPEGWAKVVKIIEKDEAEYRALVRFDGEREQYERRIVE